MQKQEITVTPLDKTAWEIIPNTELEANSKKCSIIDILKRLGVIEKELGKIDKYVEYCAKKYKPYKFEVQLFMKDKLIGSTVYAEKLAITAGQFSGYHFWG